MYWDCSGRILNRLNGSLHESLGINPAIILTAFFEVEKCVNYMKNYPKKLSPN